MNTLFIFSLAPPCQACLCYARALPETTGCRPHTHHQGFLQGVHTPCQDVHFGLSHTNKQMGWAEHPRELSFLFSVYLSERAFYFPRTAFRGNQGSFLSLAASSFLFLSLLCGELLVTSLMVIILEITSTSSICLLSEAFLRCSSRRAGYSAACFQHSTPLLWVTEGKSGSKAASLLVFWEAGRPRKEGTWLCRLYNPLSCVRFLVKKNLNV